MPDLEALLEEIAQSLLGRAQNRDLPPTLEGLWRTLSEMPGEVKKPTWATGPASSHTGLDLLGDKGETGDEGQEEAAHGLEQRLRECQKRFSKKVHEVEELKRQLAKAREEQTQAQRERDRAKEEAARSRKELAQLEGERERIAQKLAESQEALASLEGEVAALQGEKEALEDRLARTETLLKEATQRLEEAQGALAEGKRLKEELDRIRSWRERLPEPFPKDALFRLLVLDYPRFGDDARTRIQALLEAYHSLKEGRDHPVLAEHTNFPLLEGRREGLVLLGVEVLLQDLTDLPLVKWVRTHALRLESFLNPRGQKGEG